MIRHSAISLPQLNETVPIIAVTANVFAGKRACCLAVVMDEFIAKPVDPDMRHATLFKWLKR